MGKLFVIMGKSASGKDHIFKAVVERCGELLKTVIPYTTRPMRANECEGVEYHFVTDEQLANMRENRQIIECRSYRTVQGVWSYFTADDGQIDLETESSILIATPEAYRQIREFFGEEKVVPLYIEVDDENRLLRAMKREKKQQKPDYKEMCRRFLADSVDFDDSVLTALGIEKRFENIDLERCIEEVISEIKKETWKDSNRS